MVPIIWLHITVVVVISFSIIVLCTFISLLLVTVGIIYSRLGNIIGVVINILIFGRDFIEMKRLQWYGHVKRMQDERLN